MRLLVISTCLFAYVSLSAEGKRLSDVLQEVGEKKKFVKSKSKYDDNSSKKKRKFIFKDTYDTNGIGLDNKEYEKNKHKSKSFDYDNNSRFKFKFSSGSEQGNIMTPSSPSGSGMSGGHGGGGRGGR